VPHPLRARLVLSVLLLLAGLTLHADDWPQFRGPTGQGHSAERGLPLSWSETQNVVWKVPVEGRGWSSPVVANGRVWLTTAVDAPAATLRVLAFEVATGREVVNTEVFRVRSGAALNPKNSRASPTPILDGGRVYVHFGAEGTAALATSGEVLWRARLPYDSPHGNGGSPALYRDLLIFSGDGSDTAFVAALDTGTGKVRWRTSRRAPFDQAYTTPLVITTDGLDQLVSIGAYRATAYEPLTGKELWRVSYADGFSNVPRPVFGHGLVYITTGFQQPSLLAVRPDGSGDVTRTHVAWRVSRGVPFTPSPILVGGELYMVSDLGVATCLDAQTGAVLWTERLGGNYSASPVFADGRLYFQSEDGLTTVLAPGRQFRVLARSELGEATLASMAIANGSFYLRSISHLYRIGTSGR